MFVDFFIRRPVFATVCALLIVLAGAVSIPVASHCALSGARASPDQRHHRVHRRQCRARRDGGHHSARTADQRRRGNALHHVDERERRHEQRQRGVRPFAQSGHRFGRRAKSGGHRRGATARASAAGWRHRHQVVEHDRASGRPLRRPRAVLEPIHQQLRRRLPARLAPAHQGGRRGADLRRAAVLDAALVRSRASRGPLAHGVRRPRGASASRTSTSSPVRWASRRRRPIRLTRSASMPMVDFAVPRSSPT